MQKNLAERVSNAIYSYSGNNYTVGTVHEIYCELKKIKIISIYQNSEEFSEKNFSVPDIAPGTSIDWFLATAKSNFSYCVELPSLDFVISEEKIPEIGLEVFEAIKVFGKHIEDNFVYKY